MEHTFGGDYNSFGITLDPAQVKKVRATLQQLAPQLKGKARANATKLLTTFNQAASDLRSGERETVKFALIPDAIGEENVHERRIQTMLDEDVKKSQSKDWIDKTTTSDLFKKSSVGRKYKGKPKAIQAIEFIDKIAAGQFEDLEIDPVADREAIISAVQDWAKDYETVNGNQSWKDFAKLNETAAYFAQKISETSSESEAKSATDTVEQAEQRQEARDDSADVGAVKEKIRQHSVTLRENGFPDAPLVPYIAGTDAEKAREANEIIGNSRNDNYVSAEKIFYDKNTPPKLRGVVGTALIDHLGSIGEIGRAIRIATDVIEHYGTAGETLQAAKLISKYDFATGLMLASKAATKRGRNLSPKETLKVESHLSNIAITTENQSVAEHFDNEVKQAVKDKDAEIKELSAALRESEKQRALTVEELDNIKKSLNAKPKGKTETRKDVLAAKQADLEAKIREAFKPSDVLQMAVENTEIENALIETATLDLLNDLSPEQIATHLSDLTNGNITAEDFADIHLKAWESLGRKPREIDTDVSDDATQRREDIRRRLAIRKAHEKLAKSTRRGAEKNTNVPKPNVFDREVRDYGEENGYTDAEIVGAIVIPKIQGQDAVQKWKDVLEASYGEAPDFRRSIGLRRKAIENVKQKQIEARAERENYKGSMEAFENSLSHTRIASRDAKSRFDAYAKRLARNIPQKIAYGVYEGIAALKGLSTWGEISYIARQGLIPLITDSRIAVKADWQGIGHGLQSDNVMFQKLAEKAGLADVAEYLSNHNVSMFIDQIRQHPRFLEAQNNGVRFTQIGDFNIADDHFSVRALERIPFYKRTELAYTLPGDLQRLYMYEQMAVNIEAQYDPTGVGGIDATQVKRAKKYAAETANAFTGKGDVKKILAANGAWAKLLNITFFSPQLLISRFQSFNRLTTGWATAPKGMKWQMAKKGMRFYGFVGLLAALTGMALDPDDDDFGKINVKKETLGNPDAKDLHFDLLGGMGVPMQTYFRLGLGIAKSIYTNDKNYLSDSVDATVKDFVLNKRGDAQFARSKLSPGMSIFADMYKGTDYLGRPITPWGEITTRVAPLSWQQVYDAALYDRYREMVKEPRDADYAWNKLTTHERKPLNAIMTLIPSFIGVGITQYPKTESSPALQLASQLSPARSKKTDEQLRQEGGLRNLIKAQGDAVDKTKATSEIQRWLAKYPALRSDVGKMLSQVNNDTGLLQYYAKDLNADQLQRVLEKAKGNEREVLQKMLKTALKKENKK